MPPPTQRRMLANITQQADSQHNRELQHESEQQQGGAPVKPQAVAEPTAAKMTAEEQHAHQMSYLQRQYHTAALSESIRSHNEYVQQHKSQQQQQSPTTPSRGPAGRGPAGRGGANNRRTPKEGKKSQQQSGGGGMAPHPNHADVDGYPCPCPDCNLARLQEAMAEGAPQHHQHHQQQDSELAMLHAAHQHEAMAMQQQHHHSHHGYDAGYYGGGGYPQQQQQHYNQQQQGSGPYRQHSPYAPVSVGYSPNNGYYGLAAQSAPNSPAAGGYDAPGAASFDVPYIPAPRNNYARFAMAPEGTPSDEGRSPTDMAPTQPQPQQRKGRQAPPRANGAGKKDHAKLSPASQGEGMAFPTAAVPAAPAAAGEEGTPATPIKKAANAKGARKASPAQDTNRRASPAEPAAPRPPCPHALKVRCSPWHTRCVISPFAVALGDCVVFEGDRGKDAGIVVEVAANEADSNATGRAGSQVAMALAPGSEADATAVARADEDAQATVDTAATLVEKLGLRMRVVGAVYQHDRQKLTFMYEASDRVDFRQLLRELYTEFRCRIWLEVPPGAHNPAATRASAANKAGNRSPSPPQQQSQQQE